MNAFRMRMPFSWRAVPELRELKERLSAFARLEGGAAAIFFALISPVWLGGLALGAEVGVWYYSQQKLQATADAVGFGIAARIGTGPSQAELDQLANAFLTANQFDFAEGTWEVTLSSAPQESVFVDGTTVTVRLTRSVRRYLSGIFQPGEIEIRVSATARVNQATEACILSLGLTDEAFGLQVWTGNARVTGCEVLSNGGNIRVWGGTSLAADCIRSAGQLTAFGTFDTLCPSGPVSEAGFTLDPYFSLPDPEVRGVGCNNDNVTITANNWGAVRTMEQDGRIYARFCSGANLTISGTVPIIIPPRSTFIFEGGQLVITDTDVVGNDVSFYFTDGGFPAINAPGNTVNLATGDPSGMLLRGAKTNALDAGFMNQIRVGPGSRLDGAVYFPASDVQFQASGTLGGCMQLIGRNINLWGTWQLNGPCNTPGLLDIIASRVTNLTR
ncbi:TadE/TadG family type IV pilus assembly protein [Microvirga sp. M2]|uniref:TadE/TadG family type IV pilus assembly protein n=1 Tax=Microvirga sp. M2 TaxID=3073270 RepID=UPI0039C3ABFB